MGRTVGEDGEPIAPSENLDEAARAAVQDALAVSNLSDLRIGARQLFLQTTEQTRMAVSLADPHQEDCPLVYVNQAFLNLTGYAREDLIGRNCRFLQGRGTKPSAISRLRTALEKEEYAVVDILNYRKDGSAFWNAVHVGPIYDEDGKLAYYFGSQWDITELLAARETIVENERIAAELRHRTDNLFGVLSAIVRLSSRGAQDAAALSEKIERRIEALASAHKVSLSGEGLDDGRTNLASLAEAVMRPYRNSHAERILIAGELVELPRKFVTPIGLTLHELATNALKYGALAQNDGRVEIDWVPGSNGFLEIHWIEHLGIAGASKAIEPDNDRQGSGQRLIEGVIRGIGGRVETRFEADGLRATILVPQPVPVVA
ncbi:PAS domain-containing protein [Qipengyuania sp. XHP0207]|uniref:PAS domain-containing protein n=1 Tax=Qipengyuania sp. XHP0207 TaxID=3038078 RepID=UPI00241F70EC|nr:PAS domain-containing protein [Qipengyuania sp. XHP0207]MDG5748726.1 PAS domain-containing protein [Qipengyuania sp. XHP0207]